MVEEKNVTVSYKAEMGGRVSKDSETININDEEAAFEGATATPWNEKWQFVQWVDDEGSAVSNDATLIPTDIEEDTTFTAKFEKLENMPAINEQASVGGMNVSVSAEEGIFPEGTTVSISSISEDAALDTAKEALGENVSAAKGVDITFYDGDGNEIQPADSKYVHVSISLEESFESDEVTVLHDHDGVVEQIAEASADGAEFDSNQFSIYILAEVDNPTEEERKVVTYNFYEKIGDTTPFNTQKVKNNEKLADPGIPSLPKGVGIEVSEFNGWYTIDESNQFKDKVSFGTVTVTDESLPVVNVYANISTTYYVTFLGMGKDGDGVGREVVQVIRKTVSGTEQPIIQKSEMPSYTPKLATQAFDGWSVNENAVKADDSINAAEHAVAYAVVVNAHWIFFDKNGKGATYTAPVYVEYGKKPQEQKPDDPIRKGYRFDGWFTKADDTGAAFDWNEELTDNVQLYAHWTSDTTSKYTVIIWQQKVTDDKNLSGSAKSYDYFESFQPTGATESEIKPATIAEYTGKKYTGFHYSTENKYDIVDGTGAATNKIKREGDTVVNVYFDRDLMTVKFYKKSNGQYLGNDPNYKDLTGLYDQPFSMYGYSLASGSDYIWRIGKNSTEILSMLSVFKFKGYEHGLTDNGKTLNLYRDDYNQSRHVTYYAQDVDDANKWNKLDTIYLNGGNYHLIDKYQGFTIYQYRYNTKNGGAFTTWAPAQSGSTVLPANSYNEVEIRLLRNIHKIVFFDGDTQVTNPKDKFNTIPYEKKLTSYEADAPKQSELPTLKEHKGFIFVGWYEDPHGTKAFSWDSTMPDGNKVLYAKWSPLQYHVNLFKNSENATFINNQGDDFFLRYVETLKEFEVIQRSIIDNVKR